MTSKMWFALALTVACGKKGDSSAPAVSITQADVDAVNALVPAELKDKVQFEVGKIVDDFGKHPKTYTLVAPKGWKKGFMPGSLEPTSSLSDTSIKVGDSCDGSCQPKDWAAATDKVYYKQYTSGQATGKVLKDDKQKLGRTFVFQLEPKQEQQGTTTVTSGVKGIKIITTWWQEGGSRYYACDVSLGESAMGLEAAFEKACSKVSVSE